MKYWSKTSVLLVLVIIVSACSVVICIGALNISTAATGVALESKEIWDVSIDNLSTIAVDCEDVVVTSEPSFNDMSIEYAISFANVGNYGSFQFTIKNSGTLDAKIKDIKITGLGIYQPYINIAIEGLKKNDVIKAESVSDPIVVVTTYNKQYYVEESIPSGIKFDNIEITVDVEK